MLSASLLLASAAAAPLLDARASALAADDAQKCVSYVSLADDSAYVGSTGVQWCEKNCAVGFCPEDRCTCVTAADAARKKKKASGPHVSDEEKLKQLRTQLPRKVSSNISGPWFYVADGTVLRHVISGRRLLAGA